MSNPVTLEFIFNHYSPAFCQDMLTVLDGALDNGITPQQIIEYGKEWFKSRRNLQYESVKNTYSMLKEYHGNVRRCARCGSLMHLDQVNHQPCCMVDTSSKSMWTCTNYNCEETAVSGLEVWEEAARYGLQRFYPAPEEVTRESRRTKNKRGRAPERPRPNAKPPGKCGGCGSK